MTPEILYEDNHIIIVNKPAGMLSQGDSSGEESLLDFLKLYIKKKYGKEGDAFIGLVHRLDRPVSGLMVFARTSKAAKRLHSEIISGNMEKYYAAVVEKKLPDNGQWCRLENFLVRERDVTRISIKETKDSQRADLYYRPLISSGDFTLVLIKLGTGRKHQIRAQFRGIGAPVAGDSKYGAVNESADSICLHSVFLSFNHPTMKKRVHYYSPLPGIFSKFIGIDQDKIMEAVFELTENFKDQAFVSM